MFKIDLIKTISSLIKFKKYKAIKKSQHFTSDF